MSVNELDAKIADLRARLSAKASSPEKGAADLTALENRINKLSEKRAKLAEGGLVQSVKALNATTGAGKAKAKHQGKVKAQGAGKAKAKHQGQGKVKAQGAGKAKRQGAKAKHKVATQGVGKIKHLIARATELGAGKAKSLLVQARAMGQGKAKHLAIAEAQALIQAKHKAKQAGAGAGKAKAKHAAVGAAKRRVVAAEVGPAYQNPAAQQVVAPVEGTPKA